MTTPELRTVNLKWNTDFAAEVGQDPRRIVGVSQALIFAGIRAAYAGDESGDLMAVVISGTPTFDFNRHLEAGERAVVACAPLEGGLDAWDIGVAEPGERLGSYGSSHFPHTAVAVPVGAAGLCL